MTEWRGISGYPNYEISSLGEVKNTHRGTVVRPVLTRKGYERVGLWKNNKGKIESVHKLVMEAFVGACPKGLQINHKNGVKTDNRLSNLEYVTQSENMLHAYNSGLNKKRKRAIQLTLSGEKVKTFESLISAEIEGFKRDQISLCCSGKRKTHRGFRWQYA